MRCNRENVDNRKYMSKLQANGIRRNNQNAVRCGKEMSSSGSRSSAHGPSSFNGDHIVDRRGSSSHSMCSLSDWHGTVGRRSTSGGQSENKSSGRYRPDNYRQNDLNASSKVKIEFLDCKWLDC